MKITRKRIYIILILLIAFFLIQNPSYGSQEEILQTQSETLNIKEFVSKANQYTQDVFTDIDVGNLLNDAITGKIDNQTILKKILNLFGKEIKETIRIIGSIIVIIVIHSILKSISDSLENKSISQITYYVQYILIVTLIMSNFADIINLAKTTIQNLVGFSYTLLPILLTLMMTTGSIASASAVQPVLLFLITFIGNIITTFLLPLILIGTALSIVSKVSDKVQIDKLAKYFKTSVVWILGIVLTIFVGVLSLEGSLTSSVDGITAKTAKAAVSNFIPVVGKILGDAVDTVIGCSNILKNAVGIVGVIVVIGICILPIIKLAILTITYYIAGALCQPIADDKIVSLLSGMGDTFKVLLAMLISVSVMLIIGITLVIKISNSGLMYR